MEKEVYYGDGVVTGHGLIRGRKVGHIVICSLTYIHTYIHGSFKNLRTHMHIDYYILTLSMHVYEQVLYTNTAYIRTFLL